MKKKVDLHKINNELENNNADDEMPLEIPDFNELKIDDLHKINNKVENNKAVNKKPLEIPVLDDMDFNIDSDELFIEEDLLEALPIDESNSIHSDKNKIGTVNNTEKQNLIITYSSKNSSIVDEIINKINGIYTIDFIILRDDRDLGFKSSIKEMLNMIRDKAYVIMLVSKDFLTSENCMYEVLDTMRSHHYNEKLFLIILDDAKINEQNALKVYQQYWNKIKKNRENIIVNLVKQKLFGSLGYLSEKWRKIMQINIDISEFIILIKGEKWYNYNDLLKNGFKPIYDFLRMQNE